MFKRIALWYRDWEQEQLDVLNDPSIVATLTPGYRRYCGQKIGELSAIERQQLREFSITYRGRRLWIALFKMVLAFSAIGVLFHLLFASQSSIPYAVMMGNLIGFTVAMVLASFWFNYRQIAINKSRILWRIALWALVGTSGVY